MLMRVGSRFASNHDQKPDGLTGYNAIPGWLRVEFGCCFGQQVTGIFIAFHFLSTMVPIWFAQLESYRVLDCTAIIFSSERLLLPYLIHVPKSFKNTTRPYLNN